MTFFEQIALLDRMMNVCALSVMVFIRRDLGYRVLNPLHIFLLSAALAFAASVGEPSYPDDGFDALLYFSLFVFVFATIQRAKRAREYRRGIIDHSYYLGTSLFDFRWLPRFIRRNRKIARFFDPLLCVTIGILLLPVAGALGLWLMIAGIALASFEGGVQRSEMDVNLNAVDGIIQSHFQSQAVGDFDDGQSTFQRPRVKGIPTGLGPDILRKLKQRRTK